MFQLKAEFAHKKESVNRQGCIGINTGAKFVLLLNTVSGCLLNKTVAGKNSIIKLEPDSVQTFSSFATCVIVAKVMEVVLSLNLPL